MTDEFIVDEGDEFAPTVTGEGGNETEVSDSVSLKADSAEETKEEETSEKIASESSEGKEVSETEAKEKDEEDDSSEKSFDDILADVDKEIANEKNAAYFRNGLKTFKGAFLKETEALKATYEPLQDYGDVNQILENLEIWKGLDAVETDEVTKLPVATVKPFVEKLVEKRGVATATNLFNEIGRLPSLQHEGETIAHDLIRAMNLDPNRIPDYQKFAQSGYQMGNAEAPTEEELELIPENLREAFSSLKPDERDELFLIGENARNLALQGIQTKLDSDRQNKENEAQKAQAERESQIQEQQKLFQAINERTNVLAEESGSRLYTAFTESLVSAEVDEIDAIGIANTVSMVLQSDGAEAKLSRERLEKIGIKIDESLAETFQNWQQKAYQAAAFEKQGKEKEAKAALDEFQSLETKLIRKANPIIANLLTYRTSRLASSVTSKNTALDKITKQNNGIGEGRQEGIRTNSAPITDFSESAYLQDEF